MEKTPNEIEDALLASHELYLVHRPKSVYTAAGISRKTYYAAIRRARERRAMMRSAHRARVAAAAGQMGLPLQ